jgi:hypothetical protein
LITEDIKKHEKFVKEVKDYIGECFQNEVSPAVILESFKKLIDQVIREKLKEAKTK